ncbi:MAG TPA: right-handed parallel beta-helix repeat-containing protein, partial [Noviherbaspirillum sp.]|nr:right-handed parallel beta-helix repeat-containing protein [Noviherbaspirillum sp.]
MTSGSTVLLECGRTYQGTLDLRGKSDITVRTAGTCGNATISPGRALSGWSRHSGNVFSVPVEGDVAQVIVDGQPLALAHWPNRPQTWARATSTTATTLTHAMPNADLVGASLVFRPYDWAIEARRITAYAGTTMTLAPTGNINFDGYALSGAVDFYVEGKLWMLDSPGEWAVSEGRLHVWTPDGQSPEGRVWVSGPRDGIDAVATRAITIQDVNIYGAVNGINAVNASALRVVNVHIANSSGNGILNSGGSALAVERSSIRNSRHDAIAVKWGGGGEVIRNNVIDASGTVGMPTNVHAAINLVAGTGSLVQNNTVTRSGYIGIRAFRNAAVSGNTIDQACLVLTDCGGIYTDAPDRAPLNTRIENNTISRVAPDQRLAWGIFLGEYANGVTIAGNTITDSCNGIEILNGFSNRISNNVFARNTQAHIQMVEFGGAPVVANNVVSGNTFTTTGRQEMYRLSSELGTSAIARFGSYAGNSYVSNASIFANYNGEALSFAQWRARTGQDG